MCSRSRETRRGRSVQTDSSRNRVCLTNCCESSRRRCRIQRSPARGQSKNLAVQKPSPSHPQRGRSGSGAELGNASPVTYGLTHERSCWFGGFLGWRGSHVPNETTVFAAIERPRRRRCYERALLLIALGAGTVGIVGVGHGENGPQ